MAFKWHKDGHFLSLFKPKLLSRLEKFPCLTKTVDEYKSVVSYVWYFDKILLDVGKPDINCRISVYGKLGKP